MIGGLRDEIKMACFPANDDAKGDDHVAFAET